MTEYLALWSVLWKEVPGGEKILAAGLALTVTGLSLVAAGGILELGRRVAS